jgi:chloramphenicol-sensitive protein RarD
VLVTTVSAAPAAADTSTGRGVQIGFTAYLIWGLLTIYWKQLSAFDALELIGWRMLFAGIVMAIITTARGMWPTILEAFRDIVRLRRLTAAALLLTANWGSYVWAVVNDRVIETALGYFMAPLGTMAVGVFVLKETPTAAQRLAFALAAVAVAALTVSYGRPPWIAMLIATTWTLYGLSKRRIRLDAVNSLAGETFVLVVPAAILLVAISGRADSAVSSADFGDWGFLIGTGVVTAIPLMLFASAAQSIPFTLLGPLNLIVPVINFALGWVFYDEDMPLDRVIGFAFVWAALIVVMWDRIRIARAARKPATA